jgi:hypothetical protein
MNQYSNEIFSFPYVIPTRLELEPFISQKLLRKTIFSSIHPYSFLYSLSIKLGLSSKDCKGRNKDDKGIDKTRLELAP